MMTLNLSSTFMLVSWTHTEAVEITVEWAVVTNCTSPAPAQGDGQMTQTFINYPPVSCSGSNRESIFITSALLSDVFVFISSTNHVINSSTNYNMAFLDSHQASVENWDHLNSEIPSREERFLFL